MQKFYVFNGQNDLSIYTTYNIKTYNWLQKQFRTPEVFLILMGDVKENK